MAKRSKKNRIAVSGTENKFAAEERARRGTRNESRRLMILGIICALIVIAALILPTYIFAHSLVNYTPAVFFNVMSTNIDGLIGTLTGNGEAFESRFMVVVMCAVSGAALGMCGSAYQGAFNNPLAAPKTLGVMAGGALGALVFVVFLGDVGPKQPGSISSNSQLVGWLSSLNPLEWAWVQYGEAICSMIGCFIVVGIVLSLTSWLGKGRLSNIIVIIFGQVFAATVTALISFARYYYTSNVTDAGIDLVDTLRAIENYTMMRSFTYNDLLVVVLPHVICMVIVLVMRRRLTLLSFGDDEAATMGINVNRTRYAMIAVCTIMTAIAISFCGHVAFLGFISAHISRRIVGPDFRYLLPASLFTGAGLLSLIQYICQSGLPYTSPYSAGTICSIVGAVIFLGLVLSQWGRRDASGWN